MDKKDIMQIINENLRHGDFLDRVNVVIAEEVYDEIGKSWSDNGVFDDADRENITEQIINEIDERDEKYVRASAFAEAFGAGKAPDTFVLCEGTTTREEAAGQFDPEELFPDVEDDERAQMQKEFAKSFRPTKWGYCVASL